MRFSFSLFIFTPNERSNGNDRTRQQTSKIADGIFDAIDSSAGRTELERAFFNSFGDTRDHIEYLLRENETFARAYSQYIAIRSGDPILLSQLNYHRSKYILRNGLWEDDDFVPIAEEFDKMLKKVGLMR